MTSGTFHSVPVIDVTVNRDERQRKNLEKVPELAASIRDNGLINPILITREFVLIAGERRLAAVKSLGWTHIACQYQDEVPVEQLRVLELEENIRRVDLTWQERVNAIADYHSLRRGVDPEWNIDATASELNVDRVTVYRAIDVSNEIKVNPKIADAPRLSIAQNFVERKKARERSSEQRLFETPIDSPESPRVILNEDFILWAAEYDGPKFNLIHCDFPYGVNMQKSDQAAAARLTLGEYPDQEDVYWDLIDALVARIDRIADEQCHLVFWFSMKFFEETYARLSQAFKIDPFPLLWHKSDNSGIIPDPQRGPRRVYETALFGSRGDRKIVRAVPNAISSPRGHSQHLSEKPLPVVSHFLGMLVDGSSSVLDPTCGSGTALRAAETLGAARVLGLELNPDFARLANEEFDKAKSTSKALEEIEI